MSYARIAAPLAGVALLATPACTPKEVCTVGVMVLAQIAERHIEDIGVLVKLVEPAMQDRCEKAFRRLVGQPGTTVDLRVRRVDGSAFRTPVTWSELLVRPTTPPVAPSPVVPPTLLRTLRCAQSFPTSELLARFCREGRIEP